MPAFDPEVGEAWIWLGGSLLLAALWTNLAWLFSPWVEAGRSPDESESLAERIVVQLTTWRFAPLLFQGLRLLYHVGLPFAALIWGYDAVVTRFLGLQRLALPSASQLTASAPINANWLNWAQDVGWAAALGLGSWGLLLLGGWVHRRALSDGDRRRVGCRASAWETLREALYHEIHWAFYRNAPVVALGLYWGTWAGLVLAALEAFVNPLWRRDLVTPHAARGLLLRASLAVVSCLLFLRTQNLWLATIVHYGIALSLRSWYPVSSGVQAKDVEA
jgi:hypothetical protein